MCTQQLGSLDWDKYSGQGFRERGRLKDICPGIGLGMDTEADNYSQTGFMGYDDADVDGAGALSASVRPSPAEHHQQQQQQLQEPQKYVTDRVDEAHVQRTAILCTTLWMDSRVGPGKGRRRGRTSTSRIPFYYRHRLFFCVPKN